MSGGLDTLDGCTLPLQLTERVSDPHAECERERTAAEREIARLSLALKLRNEHELHTKGARVDLITSRHSYECAGCERDKPRGECCFEVQPYRGEALFCCHGCVGRVLTDRFPFFLPVIEDEDDLPW